MATARTVRRKTAKISLFLLTIICQYSRRSISSISTALTTYQSKMLNSALLKELIAPTKPKILVQSGFLVSGM